MAAEQTNLSLVNNVVGKRDVQTLINELAGLDEFLHQAAIRQGGTAISLPKTGQMLEDLSQANHLNLLQQPDRERLKAYLEALLESAPLMHMSFTLDPPPLFTQKLVVWFRQNIHPQVLLQIGLNPTIGAGCVLRTNSKYFDMSLRQRFTEQRPLLAQQLSQPTNQTTVTTEGSKT